MNKVYFLATCSTCQKIISELGELLHDFEMQDIKSDQITEDQLYEMNGISGSYESLFSRRAMKYKSMGLAQQTIEEEGYKKLILDEYTFLKRPVFVFENQIFIGNAKKTIESLRKVLEN